MLTGYKQKIWIKKNTDSLNYSSPPIPILKNKLFINK